MRYDDVLAFLGDADLLSYAPKYLFHGLSKPLIVASYSIRRKDKEKRSNKPHVCSCLIRCCRHLPRFDQLEHSHSWQAFALAAEPESIH